MVENIYADKGGTANAPFDQRKRLASHPFRVFGLIHRPTAFYLVIDLAVGGNSGWFPDILGGKPWYDGSLSEFSLLSGALV